MLVETKLYQRVNESEANNMNEEMVEVYTELKEIMDEETMKMDEIVTDEEVEMDELEMRGGCSGAPDLEIPFCCCTIIPKGFTVLTATTHKRLTAKCKLHCCVEKKSACVSVDGIKCKKEVYVKKVVGTIKYIASVGLEHAPCCTSPATAVPFVSCTGTICVDNALGCVKDKCSCNCSCESPKYYEPTIESCILDTVTPTSCGCKDCECLKFKGKFILAANSCAPKKKSNG